MFDETLHVYPVIFEGVKRSGVKRLLCVGDVGTLFIAPGLRLMDSGRVPESFLPGVKALGEVYLNILLPEKMVDWVFFSPAASLEPGKRTGKFRLGKDDMIVGADGESRISVQDYAAAMIDELEKEEHHCERFTVGY